MHTYEDFLKVIATLRGENGCPWDREQTHASLKQCMMEEAYEVMDGIQTYEETGDDKNLKEELGDVLLQVVMHAQIAAEEGRKEVEKAFESAIRMGRSRGMSVEEMQDLFFLIIEEM